MAFYICIPQGDMPSPPGKIVRVRTLDELRRYLRHNRRAFRIYFHDLGSISVENAIDCDLTDKELDIVDLCLNAPAGGK